MVSLLSVSPFVTTPCYDSKTHSSIRIRNPTLNSPISFRLSKGHLRFPFNRRSHFHSNYSPPANEEEDPQEGLVQDLRVPEHWSEPPKALEESEWLRVCLHKWLDDEYCPEATNVHISNVAANSYFKSLVEKQTDLGEILLRMARELESISYQESFHGAFSSANAAVNLIVQRIELE